MTWGASTLALIAASIAVPALVILYFLKLRRRTVEVSTTLLWKKAIQDMQANAPFQRLRKNLLLLLQLIVLAGVLLAVAQPRIEGQAVTGERHVFLIDTSASMNARDVDSTGEQTRLERAKEIAIEQIDQLRDGSVFSRGTADEAMVISFGASGEIVAPFTSDKASLRAAVRAIEPTDTPSSVAEAFKLAQAQRPTRSLLDTTDGETTTIEVEGLVGGLPFVFHLLSDGRLPDAITIKPEAGDTFVYHAIGQPHSVNIGITGLRAERGYENPAELTVFVGLQSTDPQPRVVDVELALAGAPVAIKSVPLPAAEPRDSSEGSPMMPATGGVVFDLTYPDGVLATIRVRTGSDRDPALDVLDLDNVGNLVIPPAKQTAVAVVTRGNLFITEALGGMPLSELVTMTPGEFQRALDNGDADRFDVVVLDGWLPEVSEPGRSLPPGRWLVTGIVPGPPLGAIDGGESGASMIIDWRRTHPVLRDVTLDGLRIGKGRIVELGEGSSAVSLAESPTGPAIMELGSADVRAIVVAFDIAATNWPFDVGFVVFLASALDYLADEGASAEEMGGASRQFRPGQVLTARLPQDASSVRIRPPGGDAVTLIPAADGAVVHGPIKRAGVYRIDWSGTAGPIDVVDSGRTSRFFASNLLDADESDVAAVETLAIANDVVSADDTSTTTTLREYWPYLLLAALAVIMLEWFVYNKKVYI